VLWRSAPQLSEPGFTGRGGNGCHGGNVVQAGTKMNPASGRPCRSACHDPCAHPQPSLRLRCTGHRIGSTEISLRNITAAVVGGMENMDQAPYLVSRGRWGYRMGDGALYDSVLRDRFK
jgi:acetyl-CoA C-acetyltransferase